MHVPFVPTGNSSSAVFFGTVFGLEWVPMRCELIEDRCASIVRAITRVYTTVRVVIITGSRLLGDREIDGQRLKRIFLPGHRGGAAVIQRGPTTPITTGKCLSITVVSYEMTP